MAEYGDIVTSLRDLSRIREGIDAVKNQLSHSGQTMMMLGPFMFALDTAAYNNLVRTTSYLWPGAQRVGARPTKQFTGIGEDKIKMNGVIYPHFKGGLYQVQGMRELAGLGVPYPMVDGNGKVWGEWVIEKVEEQQSQIIQNGAPMRQGFSLDLSFYPRENASPVAKAISSVLG